MPEIELERADPEDDSIIVTKDPDTLTDKKLKIERTMSKKVQSNDFHPLGTTPSRVTTICEGGTTNDKNGAPSKLPKYALTRMGLKPGTPYESLSKQGNSSCSSKSRSAARQQQQKTTFQAP